MSMTIAADLGLNDFSQFDPAGGYTEVPFYLINLDEATLKYLDSLIYADSTLGAGQVRRQIKDNALQGLKQAAADNKYHFGLGTPFMIIEYADGRAVLHQGAHRVTALLESADHGQQALIFKGVPPTITDYIDTNVKGRSTTDIARSHDETLGTKDVSVLTYMASFLSPTGRRREVTSYNRNAIARNHALMHKIQKARLDATASLKGGVADPAPEAPLAALVALAAFCDEATYKKALQYYSIVRSAQAPKLRKDNAAVVAREVFMQHSIKTGRKAGKDRDYTQRLLTDTFDAFMQDRKLSMDTYIAPSKGKPLMSMNLKEFAKNFTYV